MRLDANGGTQGAAAKPNDVPQEGQESAPDLARLQELWNTRQNGSQNNDYPIGPGDILTISVPDIEQLSQRRVRVSTHGTIELPLIGTIPTGGLSEDGLATEIDNKLQKYMYNPQATVFVDEYRNREVAVIGAVNHPGLVLLNSPDESLLDVLTQSGGLSGSASNEVILIPSRPGTVSMSQRLASVVSRPMPATGQTVNDVSDTATGGDEVPGAKVADAGASATSWNGSASSRYTDLAGSSSDAAPGAAGNDTSQVGEGSASSSDGPNGGSQT
ncbi:MAG TPA: polysaccharide biosynthesis/export family protein, partial [Candidatus Binataceae bacterium]|nr:polysaccharide biosynthesis/export family protein [Candidatus Binataceae bacterium]